MASKPEHGGGRNWPLFNERTHHNQPRGWTNTKHSHPPLPGINRIFLLLNKLTFESNTCTAIVDVCYIIWFFISVTRYLAIYNNEHLVQYHKNGQSRLTILPNMKETLKKIAQDFKILTKVAKFRQIWSHCSTYPKTALPCFLTESCHWHQVARHHCLPHCFNRLISSFSTSSSFACFAFINKVFFTAQFQDPLFSSLLLFLSISCRLFDLLRVPFLSVFPFPALT